jgi:hypothetical protein
MRAPRLPRHAVTLAEERVFVARGNDAGNAQLPWPFARDVRLIDDEVAASAGNLPRVQGHEVPSESVAAVYAVTPTLAETDWMSRLPVRFRSSRSSTCPYRRRREPSSHWR